MIELVVNDGKTVLSDFKVGGILCYYPGEYNAFAVGLTGDKPWISEKKDYLNCIKEFKKIISSLKSGAKGTKGKFIFNQIPSLEPNEPIKPIDTSLMKPETLAAIRKILNRKD